ncbi:preprotein translocase subunit YajC [Corynebacterium sp.]|uniref:preprotein translocase subunit YajC n=1 Tax=Corynebacterium sp. TaxID=1720 RepID=UPI0026DAAB17|nr:preprotein translocase subunit YajC [Corynebacterium sp.]MDO5077561.1 preprotein translocase subunit YajC [Corynebacterium sp.]
MPEILILVVVLIVFLLPPVLQLRRQQRLLAERRALQADLKPGDMVVTTAGVHGVVAALGDSTVDLEIAPSVVTVWDVAAVVRRVERAQDAPEG